MTGDGYLSELESLNNKTGEKRTMKIAALFSFIGATPQTEWLPPEIEKDEKNFVRTGITLAESPHWKQLLICVSRTIRLIRVIPG